MSDDPRVTIQPQGPYLVQGKLPLVRTSIVSSDEGESLTWRSGPQLDAQSPYALCRCGRSDDKPFCDGSHADAPFEDDGPAERPAYDERAEDYPGKGVVMRDVRPLCSHAGFCTNRVTNAWKMTRKCEDIEVRSLLMAMVKRCPSGALTMRLEESEEDIEPDLPLACAVVDDGPLWLTGGVQVTHSDGTTLETRNRVTLCRCGASENKPFCDGSHADVDFSDGA